MDRAATKQLSIPSYAKINLGLRILRRRSDGYHELETVFQQIGLKDDLTLVHDPALPAGISLAVENSDLPADDANLVVRAAQRFQEHTGVELRVSARLVKRIPMGAGLGGGSSNAAVTLLGLNRLYETGLDVPALEKLGAALGADVPFFIRGGMAHASGIGDVLTPLESPLDVWILLAVPDLEIATKWAYTNLRIRLTNDNDYLNLMCFFAGDPRFGLWRAQLKNDFEPLIFGNYRSLGLIKNQFYSIGARFASLSGTGSAMYGLFTQETASRKGMEDLRQDCSTFLTRPVKWGVEELQHVQVTPCTG